MTAFSRRMMLAAATTLLAGSVLALALEANGIRVENKSSFGNTKNFAWRHHGGRD